MAKSKDFRDRVPLRTRIEAVKDYCLRNYSNGWCDMVIETMNDWEIAAVIEGTNNEKGAIWKMAVEWGPYAEQRRAVMNEVF